MRRNIIHMQEKANLTSLPRNEHKLDDNSSGTISIRLSTKYTVVARWDASLSSAFPGRMKWLTSAIWTPTSRFPFGKYRQCKASSMSVQPGGSTEQMQMSRRSTRWALSYREVRLKRMVNRIDNECVSLHPLLSTATWEGSWELPLKICCVARRAQAAALHFP